MVKPEMIPPIVIATLAREMLAKEGGVDDAIAAALSAWPGVKEEWRDSLNMLSGLPLRYTVIILPLIALGEPEHE